MVDDQQHQKSGLGTENLDASAGSEAEVGPLLGFEEGQTLERYDRKHPGQGGDPRCPRCSATMVRSVELHRAPRSDNSPFRIRLVCSSTECKAWTVYNWQSKT